MGDNWDFEEDNTELLFLSTIGEFDEGVVYRGGLGTVGGITSGSKLILKKHITDE